MKDFLREHLDKEDEKRTWQIYHRNSNISPHISFPRPTEVVRIMKDMYEAMPYDSYPKTQLPEPLTEELLPLMSAIKNRATPNNLKDVPLTLAQLSTLLFSAYGKNRDAPEGDATDRVMRTVPSGGALYPNDLYVHVRQVQGLVPGIYHYDPVKNQLSQLMEGDQTSQLKEFYVQKQLLPDTSVQIFIASLFERTTFKYGETGYRFALMEAGHIGQNVCLTSQLFALATVCVGGFYGAQLDKFMGFNSNHQSVIYTLCIGAPDES